jgi:positive regulator of sigma E activity
VPGAGYISMHSGDTIHRAGLLYSDRSLTFLLVTNLATVVFAVLQQWTITDLLWIYWGQSVVIGYYNVHRIVDLDRFSTDGFMSNNQPEESMCETQRCTAMCFAILYGLFLLVYGVFLLTTFRIHPGFPVNGVLLCILAFWFTHRYSYRFNRERDRAVQNIGSLMFFPYARIIPMNLLILLGGPIAGDDMVALVVLLMLKTGADLAMHVIEHVMASGDSRRTSARQS